MNVFLLYFKQHLKLFFKSKLLCFLYLIMWIGVIVGMGFLLIVPSWIFYTFSTITRFVFYESLIFSIISYVFLSKDVKNSLEETILVISHNKRTYLIYATITLLFLLLLFNLFVLILLFINTIKTSEFSMFFTILKNEYLLNVLLPQIASFSIIVVISQIKNRTLSSTLFITVIILMSPYMDLLEWRIQPSIPVDQFVNILHLPFAFFMQHSDWSVDPLYGLQNELYKIFAICFWILLAILIINRKQFFKYKKRGVILFCINAVLLVGIYLPQSIFRLDTKWDGNLSDQNYYHMNDLKTIYNDRKVDYYIEKYDMNVNIKRQLNVDGHFQLVSDNKRQDFVLTLYHQFKISNVSSNRDMTYNREGDFLYLHFDEAVDKVNLNFSYEGYHDILYSNNQAVNLPGYFPWYPMAGEKAVYFQNSNIKNMSYGLNVYNKVDMAKFEMSIDVNYPIVCNLPKQEDKYVGESDSLTIIGGNIDLHKENSYNIVNYFPYNISSYSSLDERLEEDTNYFVSMDETFKNLFGLELNIFKNKKILICPKSVAQTQVMGSYAEFSDYIVIADGIDLKTVFLFYHLFNRFDQNPIIIDTVLSGRLYADTKEEYMQEMLDRLERNIQDLKMYPGENLEKADQSIKENMELINFLTDKMTKKGLDKTMNEIGRFILGEEYEY